MTTPTVGRAVHFFPHSHDPNQQPLHATIACVCGPNRVNLFAVDSDGVPFPTMPTNVLLVQSGEEIPTSGRCYCAWPKREVAAATEGVESLSALASPGEAYALAIGDRLRGAVDLFGWLRGISGSIDLALLDDIFAAFKAVTAATEPAAKLAAALTLAELIALATKETQVDDQVVAAAKAIANGPLRDVLLAIIERVLSRRASGEVAALSVGTILTSKEEAEFAAVGIDPAMVLTIVQLILKFWGSRKK